MGEEEADPDKRGLWRVAQPQHIDSSPSKMADNEDEVSRQMEFLLSLEEMTVQQVCTCPEGPDSTT